MAASLRFVYEGWEGYNRSLVSAITSLKSEHFSFRASEEMRSIGELCWHIADGRVDWFKRIVPDRCQYLEQEVFQRCGRSPAQYDASDLIAWFDRTWAMVDATLEQWTVDDLPVTYEHAYQGKTYALSRQWTIWRIMAHDIHHGGQLSEMLAMLGMTPLELTLL